jgi:hypothetical protein
MLPGTTAKGLTGDAVAPKNLQRLALGLISVRDSRHETVCEGPEAEGAGGSRSRDAEGGGRAGLRRVSADIRRYLR